jgi:hypothetical protein
MNRIIKIIITAAFITSFLFPKDLFSQTSSEALGRVLEYEDVTVKVIKRIHLPKGYHEGLYFDGKKLWVSNGIRGKVWIIDPESGQLEGHIEPIAKFTEGISPANDGKLFVTDWDEKKLYRAILVNNALVPVQEMSVDPAHPAGVLWNGSKLYVVTWTRSLTGTKFHLLEMDGNWKDVRKIVIKNIQEPAHLAWDGKNLWITSWYSKLVYKVDIANRKIVGLFSSPVSDATGIVWDGRYLWLTGTHGDLYQLKVGS